MLDILKEATKHHPYLKLVWVLIGLVILAAFAINLLGSSKGAIIGLTLAIIALILIVFISRSIKNKLTEYVSVAFLAIVGLFISTFLGFTISAFAISKPCNWVNFLEIPTKECKLNKDKLPKKAELVAKCSEIPTRETPYDCPDPKK